MGRVHVLFTSPFQEKQALAPNSKIDGQPVPMTPVHYCVITIFDAKQYPSYSLVLYHSYILILADIDPYIGISYKGCYIFLEAHIDRQTNLSVIMQKKNTLVDPF